ncbi:dynamin family protein-like protein [Mollisia scopiformis]|uniref:Dynamin family protein-like protein n=1 Tax=Mollisia scopiformis TaxID=149040 RepID=A0A194X6X7_MOLSC|nr:dynamin family protein-like protein [Mollisia scopiformis]KUJ15925.1 dynamin family protein-like protein [Mollisia scopiformis]
MSHRKKSSKNADIEVTASLQDLQTDEERRILDTVAQVRKCGLESILSLPQLVVCGDQSAGKSSVLEALTEIPFPRNDNLCTRFATEIILRRAVNNSLTVKIIPDTQRPAHEQETIKSFEETITDFDELPEIMEMAMRAMGMKENRAANPSLGAFARDVLSIEIEGPTRPQLTLVDIPGLIANVTKGVTAADVKMVADITDHYISQPRTICLAVISATNDHANQPILTKVRRYDPEGSRTLGIITKPDRLPAGSGSEKAFISLAQNEDVFFKLGWHVLKNRAFEDGDNSLNERNSSESRFFRKSNFNQLPAECVGIATLRSRLSVLLFEHIKAELPKLRRDLQDALDDAQGQLSMMGNRRSTAADCKAYLMQLSLDVHEIAKAAVDGHYEGAYFHKTPGLVDFLTDDNPISNSRIRAVVQRCNTQFAEGFCKVAHKYHFTLGYDGMQPLDPNVAAYADLAAPPVEMSKKSALKWITTVLARTRGRELVGNYNPLLIGELFWEQSFKWKTIATDHIEEVASHCSQFLKTLIHEKCPMDVESRLWDSKINDVLRERRETAGQELLTIMEEINAYPINYNHYYTDTIRARRQTRHRTALAETVRDATKTTLVPQQFRPGVAQQETTSTVDIEKVQQKTFIANVTTQIVERHIIRGLEKIFSPVVVNAMTEAEAEAVASEPLSSKRQREFLEDRIRKLKDGHEIFRGVMGGR